jgi:hypothetical protein
MAGGAEDGQHELMDESAGPALFEDQGRGNDDLREERFVRIWKGSSATRGLSWVSYN